jgi:Ca2+-binding RTX toxin-like protein
MAGAAAAATAFAAPAADAATYTVTNTSDDSVTPPAGSLRAAIEAANATSGVDDDIVFQSGLTGQITLSGAQLEITDAVDIQGPGADVLSVSGQDAYRVFLIDVGDQGRDARGAGSNDVTLAGLTIEDGYLYNSVGAGVLNDDADLTIQSSAVVNNTIFTDTAILGAGAGVFSNGPQVTIVDSTISGNDIVYEGGVTRGDPSDYSGFGGGVSATPNSDIGVLNSTISGNSAKYGGGISTESEGNNVSIYNSTIASNAAEIGGGIYAKYADARGLSTPVSLWSTIVGDNSATGFGADIAADDFDAGFSLIESYAPPVRGTVVETGPNIFGEDPQLAPLDDNGGTTDTHLPANTSPVVDQGNTGFPAPRGFVLTNDQRGEARTQDNSSIANATGGNGTDIGSVELPQTTEPGPETRPAPLTVRQCLGETATIVGTTGKDVIVGTDGRDVIRGLRGNDVIKSVGGNDLVCGDKGRDKIRTGDGDDTARGGNNGDSMRGGDGNDLLRGGSGLDRILGQDGDDQLFGGAPRGKRKGGGGGGVGNLCDGGAGTDTAEGCETVRDVP